MSKQRELTIVNKLYRNDIAYIRRLRKDINAFLEIDNPSERVCEEAVRLDPEIIQFISEPSEEIQLLSVGANGDCIRYINEPSEAVCIEALRNKPSSFKYIFPKTEKIMELAIELDANNIEYIKKEVSLNKDNSEFIERFSDKIVKVVEEEKEEYIDDKLDEKELEREIRTNYENLKLVRNKTKELCELAFRIDERAIEFIPEEFQNIEMCLNAVRERPMLLEFCVYRNEQIERAALTRNPLAIKFIDYQTDELKWKVLRLHMGKYAFKFMREPSYELCKAAVEECAWNIEYVPEQTEELCEIAIELNPMAIAFIKNPTTEMCINAIKKNDQSFRYMRNPSEEVKEFYNSLTD